MLDSKINLVKVQSPTSSKISYQPKKNDCDLISLLTLNQTAQKPNNLFKTPFPRQPVILMLRTEAGCEQISGLEGPKQKLAAEISRVGSFT